MTDDPIAADLMFTGWFDLDASPSQRSQARRDFFDYVNMYPSDFDWDLWRDWYENV